MNKLLSLVCAFMFAVGSVFSEEALTGLQILKQIDQNQVIDHAIIDATMVIHGRSGTRSISFKSWSSGDDKSFSEYLSPAREKGKKMLKVGGKLWTYTPEPHDRIITISGHLLKQSVMGSDLSYEDLMNNDSLADDYDAEIVGNENIDGRDCVVLELTAKKSDVTYYKQKIWVDTERWIALQSHLLAKNGKLLKSFSIKDVFDLQDRWYPKEIHFKDMLARGGGTEYIIHSIDLDTEIPDNKFTKASLRR